jgi:ketosteroid isomerase-like protein
VELQTNKSTKKGQKIAASNSDNEAQIRSMIYEFADAFKSKDINRILACYASKVVAFDLMPPLEYSGIESWREVWHKSLAMMDGDINIEMSDLHVDVSNDMAICHGLSHFELMGGKKEIDMWMRWTGGFRKLDGKWLVTHEHLSLPVDMESGKVFTDLKPEKTETH